MGIVLPTEGGCSCGRVRYVLHRAPLACYICHCHRCQKRSGSAFSFSLVVPADAVALTCGEPLATARALPKDGRNADATCPDCCSRLWTGREGGNTRNLRVGTLDDTRLVRPVAQFWTGSAQPWAVLPDILTYVEQPSDYRPMLAAWRAANAGSTPQPDAPASVPGNAAPPSP
jgi:hypothetical protein